VSDTLRSNKASTHAHCAEATRHQQCNGLHFPSLCFIRRDSFGALKARIKRKKIVFALSHTQKAVMLHAWVNDWNGKG
jgi:hypothetical protein